MLLFALVASNCKNRPLEAASVPKPPAPLPVQASRRNSTPLFWEIKRPNGNTVYLLGSITKPENASIPVVPELELAFDRSTHLLVEVDVLKQSQELQHPSRVDDNIAHYFLRKAYRSENPKRKKTVVELETGKLQRVVPLKILNQVFLFAHEHDLEASYYEDMAAVLEDRSLHNDLEQLWELWKKGDEKGMLSMIQSGQLSIISLISNQVLRAKYGSISEEESLSKRNPAMADKIATYIEGNTNAFVVVDVTHCIGVKSVVQLLTEKGYRVHKVAYKNKT